MTTELKQTERLKTVTDNQQPFIAGPFKSSQNHNHTYTEKIQNDIVIQRDSDAVKKDKIWVKPHQYFIISMKNSNIYTTRVISGLFDLSSVWHQMRYLAIMFKLLFTLSWKWMEIKRKLNAHSQKAQ